MMFELYSSAAKNSFLVEVEREEDGSFTATVLILGNCRVRADSMTELLKKAREAIEQYTKES